MTRRRGRVPAGCMEARALLIELAWAGEAPGPPRPGRGGPPSEDVERRARAHLGECEECRAFAADLEALTALCAGRRAGAGFGTTAADEAVRAALRAAGELDRAARRATARPLVDDLAFGGLVVAGLACHAALLSRLGPDGFIGLHLALYSLAPLSFYAIFRLDGRASRRVQAPTGGAEGGGNSG